MTTVKVETQGLTKRYPQNTALDNCSMSVQEGSIFGLLGPNGAGKTTLLRLLMGYLRPTTGVARIDGLNCYHDSLAVHQRVAYLPGDVRLFPTMTGRQALEFFADLRGGDFLARAIPLARRLDLDLDRKSAALSTGNRQKLGLVTVLATSAPLVILDEPTANLDPTVRRETLTLVREAQRAGRTVLFSSHVLEEMEQVCDRVVILRRGELVHEQDLKAHAVRHRVRARWLDAATPIPPTWSREGPAVGEEAVGEEAAGKDITIVIDGDLRPHLTKLAELPIEAIRIEPVGLAEVYGRFHASLNADISLG